MRDHLRLSPGRTIQVQKTSSVSKWSKAFSYGRGTPVGPSLYTNRTKKKSLWELVVKESGKNWRENLHLWSVWAAYTSNNGSFDRAGLEETENITVCLVFGHLI